MDEEVTETGSSTATPPAGVSKATTVPAVETEKAAEAAVKAADEVIKQNTAPARKPPEKRYKVVVANNEMVLADLLNVEYQSLYKLCSGPTVAVRPNGQVIYACVVEKFNG